MRFVGVRDFRLKSAAIWKSLVKEKEMVITSNGKPVAVLSSVDEGRLEDSLRAIKRAKALAAFEGVQQKSVAAGLDKTSLKVIDHEILQVRKRHGA